MDYTAVTKSGYSIVYRIDTGGVYIEQHDYWYQVQIPGYHVIDGACIVTSPDFPSNRRLQDAD